jgi:hypothetical protein
MRFERRDLSYEYLKTPFVRIVYHDVYTLKIVCISGMLNPELSYHIALLTALRIIKPAL